MRKHTLPASYINGNALVRSLYSVPVCFSANAPKQKMLLLAAEASSLMMLAIGPWSAFSLRSDTYEVLLMGYGTALTPYAGPGYGGTCWKSNSGGVTNCGAGAGALAMPLGGCGHMIRIPWWGHFMCPLANAVLGLRYRVTPAMVRLGHPLR